MDIKRYNFICRSDWFDCYVKININKIHLNYSDISFNNKIDKSDLNQK